MNNPYRRNLPPAPPVEAEEPVPEEAVQAQPVPRLFASAQEREDIADRQLLSYDINVDVNIMTRHKLALENRRNIPPSFTPPIVQTGENYGKAMEPIIISRIPGLVELHSGINNQYHEASTIDCRFRDTTYVEIKYCAYSNILRGRLKFHTTHGQLSRLRTVHGEYWVFTGRPRQNGRTHDLLGWKCTPGRVIRRLSILDTNSGIGYASDDLNRDNRR